MDHARLSEQFITLSGGVYTVPWANQLERLNFMASFASKICNLPISSLPFDGDLRIYWRIVIEVRFSFFGEIHVTVALSLYRMMFTEVQLAYVQEMEFQGSWDRRHR